MQWPHINRISSRLDKTGWHDSIQKLIHPCMHIRLIETHEKWHLSHRSKLHLDMQTLYASMGPLPPRLGYCSDGGKKRLYRSPPSGHNQRKTGYSWSKLTATANIAKENQGLYSLWGVLQFMTSAIKLSINYVSKYLRNLEDMLERSLAHFSGND